MTMVMFLVFLVTFNVILAQMKEISVFFALKDV